MSHPLYPATHNAYGPDVRLDAWDAWELAKNAPVPDLADELYRALLEADVGFGESAMKAEKALERYVRERGT